MLDLTNEQDKVIKILLKWVEKPNILQPEKDKFNVFDDISFNTPFITLGGYAGTGKTTLIGIFRKELKHSEAKQQIIDPKSQKVDITKTKDLKDMNVAFCCYTGKATRVLKTKLEDENAVYGNDTVGTIHSLIYSPVVDDKDVIIAWERRKFEDVEADLIIVDEASMVDAEIWSDLLSYEIPIIAVGDHGQLPPIKSEFNLMSNPQLKLEEIHRQAKDNPIIKVSIHARRVGKVLPGKYSDTVIKYKKTDSETGAMVEELLNTYDKDTLVLSGYNNTRVKLNKYIRDVLGFESGFPMPNDRVICLRNNHEKLIYNGMLGTIKSIESADESRFYAEIKMDDDSDLYKGYILRDQFNLSASANFTNQRSRTLNADLFDFGYALTVHKSQGSQAKRVILFEERFKQMDNDMWRRWLYTAITRAESELYVIGD